MQTTNLDDVRSHVSPNPRRERDDHNYVNAVVVVQDVPPPLHSRRDNVDQNYVNAVIAVPPLHPRRDYVVQDVPQHRPQQERPDYDFVNSVFAVHGVQPFRHPRERPIRNWDNVAIIVQPLLPLHPQRELAANADEITVQGGPPHQLQCGGPEDEDVQPRHKTSYLETMMHLFKGNIGTGCYAMGYAFKNGGLLFGTIVTLLLGFLCVHCQHVLIECANLMQDRRRRERIEQLHVMLNNSSVMQTPPPELDATPLDFAETVGLCFRYGPRATRRWATPMRRAINVLICVSQLGFCGVYVIFMRSHLRQIAEQYDLVLGEHQIMALLFVPVVLTSIIRKLKYLSYCSLAANVLMTIGIGITFYYALKDPLPSLAERSLMGSPEQLPLFYGTAIFAFEGIALVLPLQNEMRSPADFSKTFGVLNVGMVFIVLLYIVLGFVGYLRWGDAVEGTMTLNLPDDELLAVSVKVMISTGVLLGFALQFFVAITVVWPTVGRHWSYATRHFVSAEIMFRVGMVLLTFVIAECVPKLDLFISLIGAFCSSTLGLTIPMLIELIVEFGEGNSRPQTRGLLLVKNGCILFIALVGFGTGTYVSVSQIIQEF
ncbi:proton-coupled amino acid transporter-like protein CG1139 [Anopheles cruzii]|uniref:proton-coupled amino acid transporter-like protein CG1139 n=1 Tax=Anopheles cruzii TaxID=68878 RepID=UPI0022EC39F7|nr:proton-coupled amino acid transporter-like protein CG1139 [Anopheles cruzii]